jgi:dGTP triphosphohydrolase
MKPDWKYPQRAASLRERLQQCNGALSNIATPDSDGRRRYPDEDKDEWIYPYISPFVLDRNKARRSKMLRRLGNKTQVITAPLNSHTRDREDHSMEGAAIAADIASILGLNVGLVETGMLLHDCGHMPCGHAAEDFLTERTGKKWRHYLLGVIIAQQIERRGHGLNLTWQVLDIVLNHSRGSGDSGVTGMRQETAVALKSDKIAYVFSDYNDIFYRKALAAQDFSRKRYPQIVRAAEWFGNCQREREFTCIASLCIESAKHGQVSFDESEAAKRFEGLKQLMYEQVYTQINRRVIILKMTEVYEALEKALRREDVDPALVFALIDDRELDWLFKKVSRNEAVEVRDLNMISVGEIIPHIRGRCIDVTDPDMDW